MIESQTLIELLKITSTAVPVFDEVINRLVYTLVRRQYVARWCKVALGLTIKLIYYTNIIIGTNSRSYK